MDTVMTVTGPVPADRLGPTLVHEHVFLDLTRDVAGRNSLLNDPELAYRELARYREAGGVTLVDQTTGGLRGHDHDLLPVPHARAVRQVAERTGLQIVLGAGWYREPYYERRLWRMKTDEIAEELVRDVTVGSTGRTSGPGSSARSAPISPGSRRWKSGCSARSGEPIGGLA